MMLSIGGAQTLVITCRGAVFNADKRRRKQPRRRRHLHGALHNFDLIMRNVGPALERDLGSANGPTSTLRDRLAPSIAARGSQCVFSTAGSKSRFNASAAPRGVVWRRKTNGSRYTAANTILLGFDASTRFFSAPIPCARSSSPSRVRKSIYIHQSPGRNGMSPGARKEASQITRARVKYVHNSFAFTRGLFNLNDPQFLYQTELVGRAPLGHPRVRDDPGAALCWLFGSEASSKFALGMRTDVCHSAQRMTRFHSLGAI